MTEMQKKLLVAFLTGASEMFQEFLENRDIEPTEAEVIVGNLAKIQVEK